jgi:hypothetical chaperone protein
MTNMNAAPLVYAIDFGTTNSLIAAANAERVFAPLSVDPLAADSTVLRSILFFPEQGGVSCGRAAIRASVDSGMRGRLIRSIKRFLPAPTFTETRIGTQRFSLEELIAIILRTLRERANQALSADVRSAVIGCPARFSDEPGGDELARQRLRRAAEIAGFSRVALLEEPVAAALDCADRADRSELVAVLDLGGGTSDFTVARLGAGKSEVLSVGGIALAGDALEGALMRHHVSPHFGSRVSYRLPFGENVLTFPKPLLEKLCSPAELSLLDRRDVLDFLRTIKSFALDDDDRERMDRLLCLVEDRLGFQIFETLDGVKRELSAAASAHFQFSYPGIELDEPISRADFEASCASAVDRVVERFDATLAAAKVARSELDRLYFTGGTAQVPCLVRALSSGVDESRVQHVSTYHAVIQGLAERARVAARNWADVEPVV